MRFVALLSFITLVIATAFIAGSYFQKQRAQQIVYKTIAVTPSNVPFPTITPTITPAIPTKIPYPSQKSLKLASEIYEYSDDAGKEEIIKKYSPNFDATEAIKNWAFFLDQNPDKLELGMVAMDKYINDRSKLFPIPVLLMH